MTELYLSSMNLNGTLPESWSSLNKLQNLMIVNTVITGQIPSSWFTGMTAMKDFQLWDNQLDGPIPVTSFQLWTGIA